MKLKHVTHKVKNVTSMYIHLHPRKFNEVCDTKTEKIGNNTVTIDYTNQVLAQNIEIKRVIGIDIPGTQNVPVINMPKVIHFEFNVGAESTIVPSKLDSRVHYLCNGDNLQSVYVIKK